MKMTKVLAMLGLLIGLCAASTSRADAQCGVSLNNNRPVFANSFPVQAERKAAPDGIGGVLDESTIVGLWDVKFISGGQVVDEGFDQYHSDGTEILNDIVPPVTGNICLGVYVRTAARSIKLKHPSWIYDPSNTFVIGRATIFEQITVDGRGRTFKGTFTIQFRDLAGNPLAPDFSGDLRGERITPE